MFCPQCKSEYIEGIKRCPDCDVLLVNELNLENHPDVKLVEVFSSSNQNEIALAKSIFDGSSILYIEDGQALQDLLSIGVVKFKVNEKDEEIARELLRELPKLLEYYGSKEENDS